MFRLVSVVYNLPKIDILGVLSSFGEYKVLLEVSVRALRIKSETYMKTKPINLKTPKTLINDDLIYFI